MIHVMCNHVGKSKLTLLSGLVKINPGNLKIKKLIYNFYREDSETALNVLDSSPSGSYPPFLPGRRGWLKKINY